MCVEDIVSDIVKSIKPKVKDIDQEFLKKHFTYNKTTGVLKVKKPWCNACNSMRRGDIVNKTVVGLKGRSYTKGKLVWCLVNGSIPKKVYMKTVWDGYKLKNLTLKYSESWKKKLSMFQLYKDLGGDIVELYPEQKEYPNQETLRNIFDVKDGQLVWRFSSKDIRAGQVAGYISEEGVRIICYNGKFYNSETLLLEYFRDIECEVLSE